MKMVKFETKMKVKEYLIFLALFLQLMRLNGEASLAQEPNLLDASTNHQLQDRTTNQINNKDNIRMVRFPAKDGKVCKTDRVFKLWTTDATNEKCKQECIKNWDCVAFTIKYDFWCIGCKGTPSTNEEWPEDAPAFRKEIDFKLVREKAECQGTEASIGHVSSIEQCARRCSTISNWFAFGTNDYGTNRCENEKCRCLCETISSSGGSCTFTNHKGYRVYGYGKDDGIFWKLVANKKECTGNEYSEMNYSTLSDCAKFCKSDTVKATMFAFGTNDYGTNRCYSDEKCKCLCETAASSEGTCTQRNHKGYRLYRYIA